MPPTPERTVLLTGGGTGGHLAIVRAVGEALWARGEAPLYVGSESGQDRAWFGDERRFALRLFLPTGGVVNRRGFEKIRALARIWRASDEVASVIKAHRVGAVLSVGGFSAAPASLAALRAGIPLFIHEQNAVPGTLNRLLRPFCRAFFSSYEEPRIDYPVARSFFESARTRRRIGKVIFLGGSQGARAINDFALEAAPHLMRRGVGIIHQTGDRDHARVVEAYRKLGVDADVFAFDTALHRRMAEADLAVSRAGASTLWELAANRLPTLFVPYPHAVKDHQYHNARHLLKKGAGWVVRQEALRVSHLLDLDDDAVASVSDRLEGMITPGGADSIADALLQAARAE